MKNIIRRLSKVADSSQYCKLGSISRRSESFRKGSGVPEGHFPVYVGEEMDRYVVSAEMLNHPIFVKLLNKSAQEYGYEQKGVIQIPCCVFLFEQLMQALQRGVAISELQALVDSIGL